MGYSPEGGEHMIKKALIATGVFAVSAMAAATFTFAQTATTAPTTATTTIAPTTTASAPAKAPATGRAE